MDRIKKYQAVVLDLLNAYAEIKPINLKAVENLVIADKEKHHYQLIRVGWQDRTFVHDTMLHLNIKDERVWIQCNWTAWDIAQELLDRGIAKNDIVIGFIPESERQYTGFAAV